MDEKKVDIGCGNKPHKGYIGIDINPLAHPDLVWNAEQMLPFEDYSVKAIWLDNSLEHFKNPKSILDECFRILEYDGIIEIKLPNCQWFPLLILAWFVDIHWFWNWWMNLPFKRNRTKHYTLWTRYTLRLLLRECNFAIMEERGWHLAKQVYIKAYK